MKLAQGLALGTCFLTLVLIGIGAFVRASGSGLGCGPDWPTCSGGGVIPPDTYHAIIESTHRYMASIVGVLTVLTAIATWKWYRHSRVAMWAAGIGIPLVAFQAILGMITVKHELAPAVVASHLIVAMIFMSCMLAVWVAMYLEDPDRGHRLRAVVTAPTRLPGTAAAVAIIWLTGVMWIGAYMAESGASTACKGWPLCNGSVTPDSSQHEVVHMVHRYIAGLFIFFVAAFIYFAWKHRHELFWAAPAAVAVGVLYVLQVFVGAFNVWYTFPDWLSVSHTVIAASVWLTLSAAILFAYYSPAAERKASLAALPESPRPEPSREAQHV
jgi:heme A synthase